MVALEVHSTQRHCLCLSSSSPFVTITSPPNYEVPYPNSNWIRRSDEKEVAVSKSSNTHSLVHGEVRILKRGEELPAVVNEENSEDFSDSDDSEDPLGLSSESADSTEIEFTHSKSVELFFAGGSTFTASPPPSAVPVPTFLMKKGGAPPLRATPSPPAIGIEKLDQSRV